MSLLKNMKTDSSIADEKDSVGGGRVLESKIYNFNIDKAYVTTSEGGAMAMNLELTADTGEEYKDSIYFTSGTAKGQKNTYTDKDGKEQYLPGFNMINSLCLLAAKKELSELDTEDKVVKIYDYEAKAEVPKTVPMVMELVGKKISAAIIKQLVNKQKKGDDGRYHDTDETREKNEIDKFFRAEDMMTTAEIRAKAETAEFHKTWTDKFAGTVKNKVKAASGNGGVAGAPTGTQKPKTSLFG